MKDRTAVNRQARDLDSQSREQPRLNRQGCPTLGPSALALDIPQLQLKQSTYEAAKLKIALVHKNQFPYNIPSSENISARALTR